LAHTFLFYPQAGATRNRTLSAPTLPMGPAKPQRRGVEPVAAQGTPHRPRARLQRGLEKKDAGVAHSPPGPRAPLLQVHGHRHVLGGDAPPVPAGRRAAAGRGTSRLAASRPQAGHSAQAAGRAPRRSERIPKPNGCYLQRGNSGVCALSCPGLKRDSMSAENGSGSGLRCLAPLSCGEPCKYLHPKDLHPDLAPWRSPWTDSSAAGYSVPFNSPSLIPACPPRKPISAKFE
jgi:hypothetical protein